MPDAPPVIRVLPEGCKIEDETSDTTLRLDSLGRWLSFRKGAQFYRRCLNGDVAMGSGTAVLSDQGKADLLLTIQSTLSLWLKQWRGDQQVEALCLKAQRLGCDDYEQLVLLYRNVYPEDVPILPPDRYADIVVQPVTGCPNRACTFCAFYRDKPYRVMSADAFEQHLLGIKTLMGGTWGNKAGLFIGSANATALSQRRFVRCLQQVRSHFGTFKRGIAAFADPDFSAPRSVGQWQELADIGLVRLVIGLETGWGELRGRLGKAADLSSVRRAVADFKQAGISVGLTVLTGACEEQEQQENLLRSGDFINGLMLDRHDIVYLSPLESADVDRKQSLRELRAMKQHFACCTDAKVVPYQMQRFRYYC